MYNHRSLSLILCTIIVFLAYSCNVASTDKNQIPNHSPIDFSSYDHDSTLIIGSWDWLRTSYYLTQTGRPVFESPGTTNSTKRLLIKKDGTIEFYQNNELKEVKNSDDYLHRKLWGVLADTLTISTAHVDGSESVYLQSK